MRRTTWPAHLAILTALALLPAACASDEVHQELDGTPAAEAPEHTGGPAGSEAATATEAAEPERVTAYVVGYHWGWAVFDADGTELEVLEVSAGTEVELIAVNDHASHAMAHLPDPVVAATAAISWHDRALRDIAMGHLPDPEETEGMSLSEALTIAHDGHDHTGPSRNHALMVAGLGVEALLDAHADEPVHMVFTVDDEGTYEFRCTEECGLLHDYQRRQMLVVT